MSITESRIKAIEDRLDELEKQQGSVCGCNRGNKEERGEEWYDNLKLESSKIRDKNYKKVEQYLLEETEKLTA